MANNTSPHTEEHVVVEMWTPNEMEYLAKVPGLALVDDVISQMSEEYLLSWTVILRPDGAILVHTHDDQHRPEIEVIDHIDGLDAPVDVRAEAVIEFNRLHRAGHPFALAMSEEPLEENFELTT